jgi:hypothetical protein
MGRPKSASKRDNRKRPVNLTEEAYIVLMELRKKTNFNFSEYVSNYLVKDFREQSREKFLIHRVRENTKKRDEIEEVILKDTNELKEIKKQNNKVWNI